MKTDTLESFPGAGKDFGAFSRGRRGSPLVRWLILLVLLGGAGFGGWRLWERYGRAWWQARGVKRAAPATYAVKLLDLPIVVTAKGSLKALKSEVIASQVEGKATILEIVPEGTLITQKDIEDGKILVQLDSAELQERLVQQEITFSNAEAAYTQAKEAYDIQKSQTESNINEGKLNVKFGRLDLDRYVGETLAAQALDDSTDLLELAKQHAKAGRKRRKRIVAEVEEALEEVDGALREAAAKRAKKAPAASGAPPPVPAPGPIPPRRLRRPAKAEASNPGNPHPAAPASDATALVAPKLPSSASSDDGLVEFGGVALQNKREFEGGIDVAIEKFMRAADTVAWTARLWSKGYVGENDLKTDQLTVKTRLIDLDQALSRRDIFLRYDFPKEAEEYLSIYRERMRELERVEARGRSSLAQKGAERRSKEASYKGQKAKLEKLKKQLDYSNIRAKNPGIVIYASSANRRHWRSYSQPIGKGSTVHERQEIIRMPDLSSLAVSVGIHESVIARVKKGLPVRIRIDALPDLRLKGKVNLIAPLPSPKNWWNREYLEFDTEIPIEGDIPSGLKPGMSASVVIEVKTLRTVLVVPVQAVSVSGGKRVVYFVDGEREVPREVELGESNDKLVEIRGGLREGERILSQAPQAARTSKAKQKDAKKAERKGPPKARMPSGPQRPRRSPRTKRKPDAPTAPRTPAKKQPARQPK